jgi:hypothetical protein
MRLQPSDHNRQFRLPQVWAGFSYGDADNLHGEGPEFEEACRWYRMPAKVLFEKFRRSEKGLALYPLEWVSGQLDDSLRLFAEVAGLPRRQVFQLKAYPDDLVGHQGAMAYDFSRLSNGLGSGSIRRVPATLSESA